LARSTLFSFFTANAVSFFTKFEAKQKGFAQGLNLRAKASTPNGSLAVFYVEQVTLNGHAQLPNRSALSIYRT
jgi:hypothetical protein